MDVKGKECAMKGTQPCCAECGLGKWDAIATIEEEDKLEEL
jgi:hypothetical protein